MSIIRGRLSGDGFTPVPNHWLRDPQLSYKGKGLLSAIASHRDDYELTIEQLIAESKDGKDSVNSGVKELERVGYLLRRSRRRNADGTLGGYDYEVVEFPHGARDEARDGAPQRKTRTGRDQGKHGVSAGRDQCGFTTVENPHTKKTTYKKTKKKTKEPSTPGPLGPVQVGDARARDDAARANPEQESNETSPTRAALAVVARLPRHWRDGTPAWLLQRLAERIDRALAGQASDGPTTPLGADAIVAGVERFGDPDAVGAALGDDTDGGRHLDALAAVLRTVRSEVAGGTWCRLCGPADRCGCNNRPRPHLVVVADEPDTEPLVRGEAGHCDACGRDDRTAVVDESLPLQPAVCDTCREQLHAS